MKTLKIKRSQWARMQCIRDKRKQVNGESCLLNKEGGMCCLGFASEQIGKVKKPKLLNRSSPEECECGLDAESIRNAIDANDQIGVYAIDGLTPAKQEKAIAAIFARNGIKVIFED